MAASTTTAQAQSNRLSQAPQQAYLRTVAELVHKYRPAFCVKMCSWRPTSARACRAAATAALLMLGFSPLLAVCAASPEARAAKVERHAAQAASILAKRSDADSLATAGVLSRGGVLSPEKRTEQSLALLARAAEAAPERPELAWLQAQACQEAPPCEAEPLEFRLRTLDPTNGAGWMGALTRADAAKDTAAIDAALLAISHSDRLDVYWTTLIAHLSRTAAGTGAMSLQEAQVIVIGYLAAQAIPTYGAASRACKGERLQQQQIVEVCQGVAKSFEHGDTYITEMIGVAIAKRVWPEDSPEYKAAVEARRMYQYRADKFMKSEMATLNRPEQAEHYLALCERNHREQDVFAGQLVDAGESPNPPEE